MVHVIKKVFLNYTTILVAIIFSLFGLFLQFDFSMFYKSSETEFLWISMGYQSILIMIGVILYYLSTKIFSRYAYYAKYIFYLMSLILFLSFLTVFIMDPFQPVQIDYHGFRIDDLRIGQFAFVAAIFIIIHINYNKTKFTSYVNAFVIFFVTCVLAFFGVKFVFMFYLSVFLIVLVSKMKVWSFPFAFSLLSLPLVLLESQWKRNLYHSFKSMNPDYDPYCVSFQTKYMLHDIRNGGFFGVWRPYSSFKNIGNDILIDVKQTFIAQVISYRFGIISILILSLIIFMLLKSYFLQNKQNAVKVFAVIYLGYSFFITIFSSYGLLPTIFAYPIPFLGYGITSTLFSYFMLGVLQGFKESESPLCKHPFNIAKLA